MFYATYMVHMTYTRYHINKLSKVKRSYVMQYRNIVNSMLNIPSAYYLLVIPT